jgi:hypothetical protein
MAFTTDGMFYLSQADLQPSMDTLGTGVRGMFGLQNKEEAVDSILQGADYDTPEGRRAALDQIRQIDPARWEDLNKKNIEFEKGELEIQGMRGLPAKTTHFRTQVEPNIISNFVKDAINVEGMTTFAQFSNHLDNLVAADKIKTGERASKKSALKALLKQERKDWMALNKYKSLEDIQAGYAPIGGNITGTGYADKVKLNPLKVEYNKVEKEMQSLGDVVAKASEANPSANVLIHAEASKRAEVLKTRLLELKAKLREEELSGYSGDISSIFDTNAAKYK